MTRNASSTRPLLGLHHGEKKIKSRTVRPADKDTANRKKRIKRFLTFSCSFFLSSFSTFFTICIKKSQDQVKILGFYRPSHTIPILTPGIQICNQKWSQVNISIDYGYISQVILPYKVKFSKLEICQSDCRFKILAKNCVKKVSFFFQNFD